MEFELRLEGQDANEDSLLDFIDWLERAHIDGLIIQRKMLPPEKGYQSAAFDLVTLIISLPAAILSTQELIIAIINLFENWKSETGNDISSKFSSRDSEIERQIQEVLGEMKNAKNKRKP